MNEGITVQSISNLLLEMGCKSKSTIEILAEEMLKNDICTKLRVCHFLSQVLHESANLSVVQENLNYSEQGLVKTFSKYFKDGLAAKYAKKPQAIASRVYANRMGNGAEDTGEGWKYRGRGFIQLTGKDNYEKYSKIVFGDSRLLENPDITIEPSVAAKVACAFWSASGCNKYADLDDLDGVSDLINMGRKTKQEGDSIGFAHRKELFEKLESKFKVE